MLAVHGLCSTANAWWYVADRLALDRRSVVAPDLRGHGQAPRAARYRIDDHAADLAALGSGWDLVIGHSLAGPIVATAALAPGFARALLLLDPVFEIADDQLDAVVDDQLSELDPHAEPGVILAANPSWSPEDAFQKAMGARLTSPSVVERCLRDSAPWHHLDLLTPDELPRTHILGADPTIGAMFPPSLADDPRLGPRVTYEMVQGVGHGIHRAEPVRVVDAARSLLAES